MKASYLKVRLLLGTVSLGIGLLAANLALFGWRSPNGFFYLLGEYAKYACAYGGFAAIILGSMLINDFLVIRSYLAKWQERKLKEANKIEDAFPSSEFFLVDEEEKEVVAQK